MAEYLGHSPTSVGNLLKGEGSLDTWIAIICYYYDLDGKKFLDLVLSFDALMRKHTPKPSDKLAARINLSEPKRERLFAAIIDAMRICEALPEEK